MARLVWESLLKTPRPKHCRLEHHDNVIVLRFTAKPEKKDDPRLSAFIEVFKSPQVKQFIEHKLPAFIPAGFNS
jgi:ABC-type metal ion transport system substrate-binding protein